MSELDIQKEKIAYLKLWLGILVVTDISLISWAVTNFDPEKLLLFLSGFITIGMTSVGIFWLHTRIGQEIERLREL